MNCKKMGIFMYNSVDKYYNIYKIFISEQKNYPHLLNILLKLAKKYIEK